MYSVAIKNNATGEIRLCDQNHEWNGEGSEFWWTEGNMSCDCNRHSEFERAGGNEHPDQIECDDTKYSILYFIVNGKKIKVNNG